jgi:Flp pilus assembly protein TadB
MAEKDESVGRLRRERRLRDLRRVALVLLAMGCGVLLLVVVGVRWGLAAGIAIAVAVAIFLAWVLIDGYRVARRSGLNRLRAVARAFKDLLDFVIP